MKYFSLILIIALLYGCTNISSITSKTCYTPGGCASPGPADVNFGKFN